MYKIKSSFAFFAGHNPVRWDVRNVNFYKKKIRSKKTATQMSRRDAMSVENEIFPITARNVLCKTLNPYGMPVFVCAFVFYRYCIPTGCPCSRVHSFSTDIVSLRDAVIRVCIRLLPRDASYGMQGFQAYIAFSTERCIPHGMRIQ